MPGTVFAVKAHPGLTPDQSLVKFRRSCRETLEDTGGMAMKVKTNVKAGGYKFFEAWPSNVDDPVEPPAGCP